MRFFVIRFFFAIIFVVVLAGIIAFARGYRLDLSQQSVQSTGILVASSYPDGAKVLIDGELEAATNSNIGVKPGVYNIEIAKDGYLSWKKQLTIKGEWVIKADALLFPTNPSLSPITSLGIVSAYTSPTQDKIIILSETNDIEKDGIYLIDNGRNPLNRINSQRLVTLKTAFAGNFALKDVEIEFSPDENEMLVSLYTRNINDELAEEPVGIYLLPVDDTTENPFIVTNSVEAIRNAWEEETAEIKAKLLETFEEPLTTIATEAFDILAFSPDETRILYTATESAHIPLVIEPPLIAANQTPESRNIEPGNIYVYDKEEDKNFRIDFGDATIEELRETVFWYVDSAHIVHNEGTSIAVLDYDGSNKRTVYSGPFEEDFVASARDGKLYVLTNFNAQSDSLPDLYSIGIR